jgi:long-chain acyl-CoA synthetase
MESSTAAPVAASTGSRTIADMLGIAAEKFGDAPAAKYKSGDEWVDISYRQTGEIVSEIARGLIDLGLQPGERVAVLCTTRAEWAWASFGICSAGGVVVPIYPTNSPEECEWVAGNSEARFAICEDPSQVAKLTAVRERLPQLEAIIVIDPGTSGDGAATGSGNGAAASSDIAAASAAMSLDDLRARGRARDAAEVTERARAVSPSDPSTFIYTSGTTGPPKGCVISHGNYRSVVSMCEQAEVLHAGDVVYLYLPLAHSFALLIQLIAFDLGGTVAYWGGDPKGIVGELMAVKPHYIPSVPRIFEKIYTLVTSNADPEKIRAATQLGLKVRELQAAGQPIPEQLQGPFEQAEKELFANVRNVFGGRLRQATTGAAPIAKEILEFFYACGVPVLEGYGMTETATASTISTLEHHKFGTVGRPLPGCEVRIAEDGEVLIRGPHIFQGY